MKIVIDNKIPYIREAIAQMGVEAVYLRGAAITSDDVADADAMIIRTRTHCDERLLAGSHVRFIATATIGYDHIDTDYLKRAGIAWANCPGCNSSSVAQYIQSTLLLLQKDFGIDLKHSTIGIVGCGHVGSKVKAVAEKWGMAVLVNDPPLGYDEFVSLERIEREADIVTFHVPMVKTGAYTTYHLADQGFFKRLERHPILINSSRGEVVDNQALKVAMAEGLVKQAVIDTWEKEPDIDLELLDKVYIGTPHIAGYSADGKVNADNMALQALCHFFGIQPPQMIVPPSLSPDVVYTGDPLQLYNPKADSLRLKAHPEAFETLRGDYPLRREAY